MPHRCISANKPMYLPRETYNSPCNRRQIFLTLPSVGMYFGWQTETPPSPTSIKAAYLVVASHHMTCDVTERRKKTVETCDSFHWRYLNRRSWFKIVSKQLEVKVVQVSKIVSKQSEAATFPLVRRRIWLGTLSGWRHRKRFPCCSRQCLITRTIVNIKVILSE